MSSLPQADLGFTFLEGASGEVRIFRFGALTTTLRGNPAACFLTEVASCRPRDAQQLMARLTGNYKRGNERLASGHPRNRR